MSDFEHLLRIVKEKPEPETGPQAGDGTPAAPLVTLQGERMKPRERAAAVLRFRAGRSRAVAVKQARNRAGVIHGLKNAKPPSFQEQCDYAASRRPPAGRESTVAERGEMVFHALVSLPGVATGGAISGISAKPSRAGRAFVFAFLVTVTSLCVVGLTAVAAWLTVAVLTLATLIYLALRYWPSRPAPLPPPPESE